MLFRSPREPVGCNRQISRRRYLAEQGMGLGAVALALLLDQEKLLAKPAGISQEAVQFDLLPKRPHHEPQAKAMISLFQHGGPSHMDLTDPKPELTKHNGKETGEEFVYSGVATASRKLLGSPWKFARHGQSGTEISELMPNVAECVDDICLIRSMHTGFNAHEINIRYFHGGVPAITGRPNLASWLLYGLGSETQNLPAYMVLTEGGIPVDGVRNWEHGFLPAQFQSTVLRPQEPRILNLRTPPHLRGGPQAQNLQFMQALNQAYQKDHPGNHDLEARIASYELAARMQGSAAEALDISQETKATHTMYGLDEEISREYGTRCLIARRLVERGVRFVQLFMDTQPWDNHDKLLTGLPKICRRTEKPTAGLLKDLNQRGMLDSTILHWGGEIGRLPVTEDHGGPEKNGRDHNGQGFSIWLAGAGIKPGMVYGKTDELGHRAVENVVTPNDYHATLLHLFGLDWQKLVYHHKNRSENITSGRPARVVSDILTQPPTEA